MISDATVKLAARCLACEIEEVPREARITLDLPDDVAIGLRELGDVAQCLVDQALASWAATPGRTAPMLRNAADLIEAVENEADA